jgi:hypothetical protein
MYTLIVVCFENHEMKSDTEEASFISQCKPTELMLQS